MITHHMMSVGNHLVGVLSHHRQETISDKPLLGVLPMDVVDRCLDE